MTGTDVLIVANVKLKTEEGKKRKGPPPKASRELGPAYEDGLHVLWNGDDKGLYLCLRELTQKVGQRLAAADGAANITKHWPELRGAANVPARPAPPASAATAAS